MGEGIIPEVQRFCVSPFLRSFFSRSPILPRPVRLRGTISRNQNWSEIWMIFGHVWLFVIDLCLTFLLIFNLPLLKSGSPVLYNRISIWMPVQLGSYSQTHWLIYKITSANVGFGEAANFWKRASETWSGRR